MTDKKRDYREETNSARYTLKVNDQAVAGPLDIWPAAATGPVYREISTAFTHGGGPLKLAVHMSAEWGISNNFFLDGWSLRAAVTEPEPPAPEPPKPEPPKPEPGGEVIGIDVSKWQGAMDFGKAAAKVDFAFIRASYGKHQDERVDEYAPAAMAAGLPYGFYHYLHFFDPPKEQVETFAAVIERHGCDLPPVLDLEDGNFNGLTVTERAAFVLEFLERLQVRLDEMGIDRLPILYTNYSYWRSALGAPKWGAAFDLWIANWTKGTRPLVPEPWASGRGWTFWQYANDGHGPSYGASSARIDLNRFNGTADDLAAYLIPRGVPEPRPPTLAETMWRLGTAAPGIANTPTFALQAAMLEDGLYPLSDEQREVIDGVSYAYRRAGGRAGETLVYYAPVGEWDAVRVVGPEDALPAPKPPTPTPTPPKPQPPKPEPQPPDPTKIDLLPYMTGMLGPDGRGPLFEVRHSSGSQARHQTQRDPHRPGWYYLTKGNELSAEWEHFGADDKAIYRGRDTSPGGGMMYTLYGAPGVYGSVWAPRRMAVGETFPRNPLVRWQRIADCQTTEERRQPSTIRLAAAQKAMMVNGIFVGDCILLQWLLPNGRVEETWTFSRMYGLVTWTKADGQRSEISEAHAPGQRPDNRRQVITCAE
jgi:GH25 family lysozyme M1 (1,4-beta-N-acetylmuramidase)